MDHAELSANNAIDALALPQRPQSYAQIFRICLENLQRVEVTLFLQSRQLIVADLISVASRSVRVFTNGSLTFPSCMAWQVGVEHPSAILYVRMFVPPLRSLIAFLNY